MRGNQGPWHLSRSRSVDLPSLDAAVSEDALPLGAVLDRMRPSIQGSDRLGPASLPSGGRWFPHRQVVVVADRGFAAAKLLAAVSPRVTIITRLQLDTTLCHQPPNDVMSRSDTRVRRSSVDHR